MDQPLLSIMKRKTGPIYVKEDSYANESDSDEEENMETENTIKKVKKESENLKSSFGFFRSGSIKLLRSQSMDSINGPFDFLPQEAVVSIFMCLPAKVKFTFHCSNHVTGSLPPELRLSKLVQNCL